MDSLSFHLVQKVPVRSLKKPTFAPKSYVIEQTNLRHLLPVFGGVLISDIEPEDVSKYQAQRLAKGAKPKTVNLEVDTLRAILRRNGLWARIQPHITLLPVSEDVGRALPPDEEVRLLEGCSASRSRSLYPAVVFGLHTCMRCSELQLLRWKQIDFQARTAMVGKSKTQIGTGRVIPLSDRAFSVLSFWARVSQSTSGALCFSFRTLRSSRRRLHPLRLQDRPHQANWPMEGSLGSGQEARWR